MNAINLQPPVKADRHDDGSLLIHSLFSTIQGEGPHTGEPAIFIRLALCNLACPMCDTIYSGNEVRRMYFHEIFSHIQQEQRWPQQPKPLIVITGGEPLRQNLIPLINVLAKYHYRIQIETNGTLPIDKDALSDDARFSLEIVCSPKTNKVVESLREFIICYKYIINADHVDSEDGLPETVLGLPCRPARPHPGYHRKIYLQPADEGDPILNHSNLDAAIQSCQKFGHTLSVQVHKMIGLP